MNSNRIEQLLEFLKNDPNDPFTRYALATEYRNTEPEKSLAYFEELLKDHPDYLPTYYHAAHLYIDFHKDEEAEQLFKDGIELAKKQEDALALRELQNAYNEFLFEE